VVTVSVLEFLREKGRGGIFTFNEFASIVGDADAWELIRQLERWGYVEEVGEKRYKVVKTGVSEAFEGWVYKVCQVSKCWYAVSPREITIQDYMRVLDALPYTERRKKLLVEEFRRNRVIDARAAERMGLRELCGVLERFKGIKVRVIIEEAD
jgi:hypothetical protein